MAVTEKNDAAERAAALQCAISHNALLRWVKTLVDEGYTSLPVPL